ncbi:MAG: hypothetical protein A2Y41_11290 [Spirochaetes bacterium GWB1_36_13]|nr:MAG: hypothetical protein A2Y41_11290 [Spirochaetes bacterium GWB1_36_13]
MKTIWKIMGVLFSFCFITALYPKNLSQKEINSQMEKEIQKSFTKKVLKQFANELSANNFLDTDFDQIIYFKKNPKTLQKVQEIQIKYRNLIAANSILGESEKPLIKEKKIEKRKTEIEKDDGLPKWYSLIQFSMEAKGGVDYFYLDTGTLFPKNDQIKITTDPFYYLDLKMRLHFNSFGLDLYFKNSFHEDSLKDNYLNRADTLLEKEKSKTRERILNLGSYLIPSGILGNSYGIYLDSEFRMFQAEVSVLQPTLFVDKTGSQTLNPGDANLINMFYQNYSIGFMISESNSYRAAFGYQYSQLDAPHYISVDQSVQTVSSKRDSLFVFAEMGNPKNFYISSKSIWGLLKFEKPDGQNIQYKALGYTQNSLFDTDTFYYSSVKNTFSLGMSDHIALSGYLGYSGYTPINMVTAPALALSAAIELYTYYHYIKLSLVPYFQPIFQLLFYYYYRQKNMNFYSDISLGVQIGIQLDFFKK